MLEKAIRLSKWKRCAFRGYKWTEECSWFLSKRSIDGNARILLF